MRRRIQFAAIWKGLTGPAARAGYRSLLVRTYAFGVFLVVLAAGYFAIHYLVATIFIAPRAPAQILQWQGRLDVAALHTSRVAGVEEAAPRSPISHYHRVDQWFQQDGYNGCTVSGCHEPLPHGPKAKVPAFANFHTTFLACQMCHISSETRPAAAGWVNLDTGKPQDAPAILQLLSYLELNDATIQSQPEVAHGVITDLLARTISTVGGDPELDQLLAQMQSTEPGSPVWKTAVAELTAELPQHARGEYQAKLAKAGEDRKETYKTLARQAADYFAAPREQGPFNAIHAPLAREPAKCLSCHDDQPGMLDFAAAGYSPRRTKYLGSLAVARLMQQVREGQSFYLPNLQGDAP